MNYGLIGEHLPHSFSKEIHERIGGYEYSLKELRLSELYDFLHRKNFRAINVTIPYKEAVIPFLDEIDENARKIGAVNTIVNRNGKLLGTNTDFGGMKALCEKIGADLSGKKVLILGTGGTSKTAFAVAESLGAATVLRVSRSGREDSLTYDEVLARHTDADVIINATPCGMFPKIFDAPINLEPFKKLSAVIDAIYNPLSPTLVTEAKKRGVIASGGLYMLVAQAVMAAEHFMNKSLPVKELTDQIYDEIYFSKRNIVLIGMPGSGKTTVGKLLADRLDRAFVDTDALIVEREGVIAEIFAQKGEKHFRDLESEVIRSLTDKTGMIIATGGGAILRQENVDALKRNGALFFLDRPLSALLPTDDRPLANSREKIIALYETRLPYYRTAADLVINAEQTAEEVTERILEQK